MLQSSNTREMVFRIPELIEYVSTAVTLEPGDVFATGTPAGVGFARRPPRWLKPGEEMVVRISGIGELRNPAWQKSISNHYVTVARSGLSRIRFRRAGTCGARRALPCW